MLWRRGLRQGKKAAFFGGNRQHVCAGRGRVCLAQGRGLAAAFCGPRDYFQNQRVGTPAQGGPGRLRILRLYSQDFRRGSADLRIGVRARAQGDAQEKREQGGLFALMSSQSALPDWVDTARTQSRCINHPLTFAARRPTWRATVIATTHA